MKLDPNYPRMMFHPSKDPVTVYSEEQEDALGPQWSRTIIAASPAREQKPPPKPPEPEPEEEPDQEPPLLKEPEPEHVAAHRPAPPAKAKRGRPPAHKPPVHKRKA